MITNLITRLALAHMPAFLSRPGFYLLVLLCALTGGLQACSPVGAGLGVASTAGIAAAQERGFSGALTDTRIRAEINNLWLKESETLFRKANLNIYQGRVLLTGILPSEQLRLAAVRHAWSVDGVQEVINEIRIRHEGALLDPGRDHIIAAKIKTNILFDKTILHVNYTYQVVDRIVFILGVAQDQDELNRVLAHIYDISHVKQIIPYIRQKATTASDSRTQLPSDTVK